MRKRDFLVFVLALSLSLMLLVGPAQASTSSGVRIQLTTDGATFSAAQSVIVHVTMANPTSRTFNVLRWFTPMEDVEEPLFVVSRNGEPVAYIGALYKRPQPTAADYVALKPGAVVRRDVDLATFYDLSVSGVYSIRYDVAAMSRHMLGGVVDGASTAQADSNALAVQVAGRISQVAATSDAAITAVTGTTSFSRCTSDQQPTLVTARTEASNYAANALSYMQSGAQGPRYTTWFGTYDSGRYTTVRNHFSALSSAMDTAPVTIDCGCKKTYYAYVYPNQPYKIFVCKAFWAAPMTGTDSKAGTLIHEMSHFNVVASTDDWAYGQTAAQSLAISNPTNAIDNADSHEYFSENTPFQP